MHPLEVLCRRLVKEVGAGDLTPEAAMLDINGFLTTWDEARRIQQEAALAVWQSAGAPDHAD